MSVARERRLREAASRKRTATHGLSEFLTSREHRPLANRQHRTGGRCLAWTSWSSHSSPHTWFLDESLRVLISHASTEGILRKSGSLARQRLLRSSLEMSASLSIASVVLASAPVHDVSGLLKQWLQLLPEPLLPKPLLQLLLRCQLAADPLSRMGAHNLALVLAPTLCCPTAVQGSNREDLDRLVSLVEVLIGSSHLVGSTPPPLPGREGRQKTKSACLLLNQLRRLVTQRKEPGGEMDAVVPDSSAATVPILPPGSKRRKPRELLPRGLSPWKRAKREEGLASSRQQQQACATPELLDKLREEVALLPPLQVEDEVGPKPGDANVPVSANPPETAAAVQEGDGPCNTTKQPEPKTGPAVPQTVHFLRGTSTTSSTKTNLRRGRPNSLRSGLPSPRPLRHGPGTRRHSSTGSRPRPPVGKENLESSLRFASQGDCVFNAPAMAHLAAVKARREAFISQLVSTGPTGPEHGSSQPRRGRSVEVPHCHLEPVVEAPLTPAKEEPKEGQDVRPCNKVEDESEPMDVDESPDVDSVNVAQESSPLCRTPVMPSLVAAEAPALHDETSMAAPTKIPSRPAAPAPCNDDFFFALPDIPPEPSPSTKRESIIQIRERNAGMVRSSVEVFNRAAAAAYESHVVTRSRRTAVASKTSATSRPPLRETNFQRPGSPTRRERRDWEMEL
ncbi:hypothetical protein MTO96_048799 [Rhipicephalus appendiculatus]